jgi:hypothetical protein
MSTARTRFSLDGPWDFQLDPDDGHDISAIREWRTATVPMPWQAQFEDLRLINGVAWYRRHFSYAPQGHSGVAILHFGAVDYYAEVWLNGQKLGAHEGGYLPFEFDVTLTLLTGDNVLEVRVVDPSDDRQRFPDMPFGEIPHGKQSWYGPIGGIWQSVWLEQRPSTYIGSLRLFPDPATGSITVAARLSGPLPAGSELQATVYDPNGLVAATSSLDASGQGQVQLSSAPALWNTDTPNLYRVEVALLAGGEVQDVLADTCGFRTVEARDGRIYLNGQPVYLRGVLDQAYYPETIYTVPSVEYLEDQARKAKALGLNCLRIHIKIEDPRYYEVADRLGLLVWTEIPNWVLLTQATDRRAKETFLAMVERDGNHPSIIAWTLVNENWGTDLTRNADHRAWLVDFYYAAKQIDPTRLIVDNSACKTNAHVAGDIEDYHPYKAIPDHWDEWDEWVDEFASRSSKWIWYADSQQHRRPDLPLIVSEFGNWGLPDPDALKERGTDPWWFQTGHEWGDGIVHPHAMRQRFDYFGLPKVFGTFERFIADSQVHMARSLHYEISSMRLRPEVGGYVITEFTDVHWECNGLLTMQREVKHGLDPLFTSINQDDVVIIRPQQWSGRPGERVRIELRAFGVDGASRDGIIEWCLGDEQGQVGAYGGLVEAPLPSTPGMIAFQARWCGENGVQRAANAVELACVVPTHTQVPLRVIDDRGLAMLLADQGYKIVNGSGKATQKTEIVVTQRYTKRIQDAVQKGARVLLLADEDFSHNVTTASAAGGTGTRNLRLPAGAIVARKNTHWEGDWATSFSWLNKSGPFGALPGSPLLEMEYADIMPDAVCAGLPAWSLVSHSWAGLALGWIHKPASLLATMPYGNGQLAVTTFKLNSRSLANNVVAQAMFDGILQLLQPRRHANGNGSGAH